MSDDFNNHHESLESPASNAFDITPGAGLLSKTTRGVYVGGDGNMTVEMVDGGVVTFSNLVAGSVLALRVNRVTAATATGLIGLY